MYSSTLLLHSWLRWVVILRGSSRSSAPPPAHRAASRGRRPTIARASGSCIALDIQFLLGLLLYFFLSPFTPRRCTISAPR